MGFNARSLWAAFVIAFFLIAVSFGAAPIQVASGQGSGNVSVSLTPASSTTAPGTNVSFTAELTVPERYNGVAADVDLPGGWSIVSQTTDPQAEGYKSSTEEWIWFEGGNKTVEFVVHVPSNTSGGSYPLVTNGSSVNPDTDEIESDEVSSTIEVSGSTSTRDGGETETGTERGATTTVPPSTASPAPTTSMTTATRSPTTSGPATTTVGRTTTAPPADTTAGDGTATTARTSTAELLTAETSEPEPTTEPPTTTPGQVGFGAAVSAVALLAASLLALRRVDR